MHSSLSMLYTQYSMQWLRDQSTEVPSALESTTLISSLGGQLTSESEVLICGPWHTFGKAFQMTITQFLILLSLAVAICFYIYLIYSGLYRAVIIERNKLSLLAKPSTIVYKFIRGPHKLWHRAFNQLTKIQPHCKSFGIFYDNPQEVYDFITFITLYILN